MAVLRKVLSVFIVFVLLFCLMIPATATSITELSGTNATLISNAVLEAIEAELQFVFAQRSQFGITFGSSNLSVGAPIQAYEYVGGEFVPLHFFFYPLFSYNTLCAFMLVRSIEGNVIAQFVIQDVEILKGCADAVAFVYDKTSRYLCSYEKMVLLETVDSEKNAVITRDDLNVQAADMNGIVFTEINSLCRVNVPEQTRAYVSCPVSFVSQYLEDYFQSDICWAASIACIGNYLTNYSYTAVAVAQCAHGPIDYNHGLDMGSALGYLAYMYDVNYTHFVQNNLINDTNIYTNISQGFPLYTRFLNSMGYGHACVVYSIDMSLKIIGVMNPDYGFLTATKINGSQYSYVRPDIASAGEWTLYNSYGAMY